MRKYEAVDKINRILKKRGSMLVPLCADYEARLAVSPELIDDYEDILSDELMEFGIEDGEINEYGIEIDRLIEYINKARFISNDKTI